jgi:hypothetical protein
MKVEKDTELIYVILQDQTRIRGMVHLPQSGRLSDLMNYHAVDRPFLAMTGATVVLPDGTRYSAPFISVNRLSITTCFPVPESERKKDGGKKTGRAKGG